MNWPSQLVGFKTWFYLFRFGFTFVDVLQVYGSVDDIDLFTGGLSETPLQGALVGPTFACIIGIQFQKLKKCDRHWYENNAASTRFSEAQLNEIRKMTLAKVVCENCDIIGDIQKSIFDQPHEFL